MSEIVNEEKRTRRFGPAAEYVLVLPNYPIAYEDYHDAATGTTKPAAYRPDVYERTGKKIWLTDEEIANLEWTPWGTVLALGEPTHPDGTPVTYWVQPGDECLFRPTGNVETMLPWPDGTEKKVILLHQNMILGRWRDEVAS